MSYHYSDPSATLGGTRKMALAFPTLSTSADFTSWSRRFQAIATHKGVWIYLLGTKKLIDEPQRSQYEDTEKGLSEYRSEIHDYEKQQEKIADAFNLLHTYVAPSIQRSLLEFSDPAEAYLSLKKQYQPTEFYTRVRAHKRMESLRLTRDKTMTHFIEEIKSCRHDITDSNGTFTDEHIILKLASSLPKDYDDFVSENIELADSCPKLDDIVKKLLNHEPKVLQRQKANNKG